MQTELTPAPAIKKSKIITFDSTLLMASRPPEIEVMDNCILVDNFFHAYEKIEENLLKFHSTNCHEINEILFYITFRILLNPAPTILTCIFY